MKRLEHLGIAVTDLVEAERIFTDVLGVAPYKREEVEDEGVITSFFKLAIRRWSFLSQPSRMVPSLDISTSVDRDFITWRFWWRTWKEKSLGWRVKVIVSFPDPKTVPTISELRFCTRPTPRRCLSSFVRKKEVESLNSSSGHDFFFLRPLCLALPMPFMEGSNSVLDSSLRVGAAQPSSGFLRYRSWCKVNRQGRYPLCSQSNPRILDSTKRLE